MQWLEWLDKKTYSGLTPKQQKIQDSIDNEKHEDPYAKEVSVSEEIPLKKLTHGKLEEVEKLKSWEVFLNKFGGVESAVGTTTNQDEVEAKGFTAANIKNPKKRVIGHYANQDAETPKIESSGNVKRPQKGDRHMGIALKHPDKKHVQESSKLNYAAIFGGKDLGSSGSAIGSKGSLRIPPAKTQKELDEEFFARKSWERWLIKETDEDKLLGTQLNEWRAIEEGKIPKSKIKPKIEEDAKQGEITSFNSEKWKSWLDKMQGAGDARFGNQHLTGLEQEPIADDQTLGITTAGDEKDDKPYKESSKKENEQHGRLK